jgi:hypothetical protein
MNFAADTAVKVRFFARRERSDWRLADPSR